VTVSALRHPTDSASRPLPDGSWPDAKGAAGALDVVRRFGNTINREHGAEAWRTPTELQRWLAREGYPARRVTARQLATLRDLREHLWRCIVERSLDPLAGTIERFDLAASVVDGEMVLIARRHGVDDVVAALVTAIVSARHDGSWPRLKACEHCDWIFYDGSKNRGGRWCSMQACGGRLKAQSYRRRHRMPVGSR